MLILSGIVLNLLIGENGIIGKAQLAGNKYKQAEINEQSDLNELYASIRVAGDSQITLNMHELDEYINKKVEEKLNSSKMNGNILWSGSQTNGVLNLEDSIYNYRYLLIYNTEAGASIAIVPVDKNGMTIIDGGSSYAGGSNVVLSWGFRITEISEDGKELTLARCGISNADSLWVSNSNIVKIIGIL